MSRTHCLGWEKDGIHSWLIIIIYQDRLNILLEFSFFHWNVMNVTACIKKG